MAKRNYSLAASMGERVFVAPRLPYQPPQPRSYRPRIGLIGCGGIAESHLDAYRAAEWEVVALCSRTEKNARRRRDEFYPAAEIYTDYRGLLERRDVDVVDIALHPEPRAAAIEAALNAGKHVLSQKPLALDLDAAQRLAALAARRRLKFAVNQNGRWAPYFSYASQAIRAGLIGAAQTVSMSLNWDHTWIKGTPFERIHHVVLSDFGIHWLDFAAICFAGREARRVFATNAFAPGQKLKPPMIASAVIQFDDGAATLHFDGHSRFAPQEAICITGSAGTIRARGPICAARDLELHTRHGCAKPKLKGKWFNDGFRGAMGELLCAIEEDREPSNSARNNLATLAICFAAIKSARSGRAEVPGKVRRLAP
jgi:predicted dehydrogenase